MTKRKLLCAIILVLALSISFSFTACEKAPKVSWDFDKASGTLTISGEGEMENYVHVGGFYAFDIIPNTPWYEIRKDIIHIVIEDGVTSIGDYAFLGCNNLSSIKVSDSIMSIGKEAIPCPETLNCNLKDGVKYIGNENNPYLIALMAESSNIKSIILSQNTRFIREGAFMGLFYLESVTIFEGIVSIEESTFCYCENLTNIEIPNSVTSIDSEAFYNCRSLTNINIPIDLTSIEFATFKNCSNLTSITIPKGVTYIESEAFGNCYRLTSIDIPENLTRIGFATFKNCGRLTNINYSGTKELWHSIDGINDACIPTGCIIHCTDGDIVVE